LTTGVTRYVGHGTLDPHEKPTLQTKLLTFMGRTGLPRAYQELIGTTDLIQNAGVDWTLVRFTAPKNTPKTGKLRVGFYGTDRIGSPSPAPTSPQSPPNKSTVTHTSTAPPRSATDSTDDPREPARMNIAVWIGLADRVRDCAGRSREQPVWASPGSHPSVALVGEVAVWRAAVGVDPEDRRPTGEGQLQTAAARWQQNLDQRVALSSNRIGADVRKR
jgi:hypothetical protein